MLRRAVELGVNHIDTAAFYFSPLRSANELINRALAPYPDDLVIATKVGPGRDPSGEWLPWAAAGPAARPGRGEPAPARPRPPRRGEPARPAGTDSIAEHFGALAELREAGLIRHLGLSNVGPEHLAEAQAIAPVVCVQNRYSIGARRRARTRCCGLRRAGHRVRAVLRDRRRRARGGREPAPSSDEVLAVARAHGVTPAQVRLAWTLQQGPHVLAIPGTGNPDHLAENVAAGALRLSPGELDRLQSLRQGA